ncbi:hypothetical protein Misp01_60130 [Microtetraspora sp. NBRC 13810]|nr:hypothetical protein Misp01_60130 [Microtetraspora sp. NBRC 13810]
MTSVDTAPFTLRRAGGELAEAAGVLERDLERADLAAVLAGANRTVARKKASDAFDGMTGAPDDWYVFNAGDNDTTDWYPQGVSCASDAGLDVRAFAVSWYWKPEEGERGARISLLDLTTLKYRHVLLVLPTPDGSFRPIDIHAGGIAWYGGHLYVADTTRGLRVFAMDRMLDMRTGRDDVGDETKIGRHGGALHAYGYRYVLPQIGSWQVVTPGPRFSFAAVDRCGDGDLLISGEYTDGPDGAPGRVARWPLAADGTLAADGSGTATAADAFSLPGHRIQGALSHEGRWYCSQSAGSGGNGTLIVARPGEEPESRSYPVGPEDLTCWGEQKTLWSVTEFKGRRALFCVRY